MAQPTSDRVNELFDLAVDLPAGERAAFLEKACGNDAVLRAEVQAILDADKTAGIFLADPTYSPREMAARIGGEGPGSRIGHYRLLELIGEGGFGSVFMAEQSVPVRRRVALKIIKLGMDTRQVVARFEAERQALAMMDHPNIARVLDAGATEAGRPYFVMELVRGTPLTKYCDENRLNVRHRLELFMQVCQAVQHAHQKGIIHRDLKPSNVLVTMIDGHATPKIIDFGIAKATQSRLTDRTLFTEFQQLIGTPAYMSPEQASPNAEDVDTRSDIYSLGVLLYELLTGTTPFDAKTLAKAAYVEVQRIIREVDPPRPSTRVSTLRETLASVAAVRAVEPGELKSTIRGELDWIVMKCLEKQRSRRYDTASALSSDVNAFLHNQPVSAAPPAWGYRTRKLIRRHGFAIGTAAAIVVSLAVGLVVSILALRQVKLEQKRTLAALDEAESQRRQAQIATASANEVNRFLNDMLASADPQNARGREVTVEMVLDQAASSISGRFPDRPLVEASIHDTIGQTYAALSKHQSGAEHLEAAKKLRESAGKVDAPEHLTSRVKLALEWHNTGKFEQSRKMYVDSIAQARRLLESNDTDIVPAVDSLREAQGYAGVANKEMTELFKLAYERRAKVLGENHPDTVACFDAFAWSQALEFNQARKSQDAEPAVREALDRMRRAMGPSDRRTLRSQMHLGRLLIALDSDDEGYGLYRDAIRRFDEQYGVDYPGGRSACRELARVYEDALRYEDALAMHTQAWERSRRIYGDSDINTLDCMGGRARMLEQLGRIEEAGECRRLHFEGVRQSAGADAMLTVFSQYDYGKHVAKYGTPEDAEKILADLRVRMGKSLRADLPTYLDARNWLVKVYVTQGRKDEAIALAREVHDRGVANVRPNDAKEVALALSTLGPLLVSYEMLDQAELPLRDALIRLDATKQIGTPSGRRVLESLAIVCEKSNRADEASALRKRLASLPPTTAPTTSEKSALMYSMRLPATDDDGS